VHFVDLFEILGVFGAPLGKNLFADQVNQVFNVLVVGEIHVFLGVLEADLDFVDERSAH
jgi:hypothetical protein